jgi:hypothetical protein
MQQITVFIDLQDQLNMFRTNICPKHVELILKINKHLFIASSWSWFYYTAYFLHINDHNNLKTMVFNNNYPEYFTRQL